jgi:hypothetical protein
MNTRKILETKQFVKVNRPLNFFFLCGANRFGKPSARRQALVQFITRYHEQWRVVFAEKVFSSISDTKLNLLDLEHTISEFSDFVAIILESESAFAELGAFCHENIRKKLLVINDIQYKDSTSFINIGPIKAIETKHKDNIIFYEMRHCENDTLDGIGAVFGPIGKHLKSVKPRQRYSTAHELNEMQDIKKITKFLLYLVHDLIYIFYTVSRENLIKILIFLLGNQNFREIDKVLSVLQGLELIESSDHQFYSSRYDGLFLELKPDLKVLAATRLISMRIGRISYAKRY